MVVSVPPKHDETKSRKLVYTNCAGCHSDNPKLLFQKSGFNIVKCSRCGLVYTNPRLSEEYISQIYGSDYFQSEDSLVHGYVDYANEKPSIQKTFRKRWDHIRSCSEIKKGRLLDIGCAMGFLLELARNDGWEVAGMDISKHALSHAKNILNLPVVESDLKSIPFPDESFDVITIWDVIEHLPHPDQLIESCYRKLKPGGLFSIITPDQGSWPVLFLKGKWVEYEKPDEHLFFFSKKTLGGILTQKGFHREWAGTAGKYVTVEFALDRLRAYHKSFFNFLLNLSRAVGLHKMTAMVNPFDKMSLIYRKGEASVKTAKVSIIVPVYNEFYHVEDVIDRLVKAPLSEGLQREIIVIDDGSTDGTTELLKNFSKETVHIFHSPINKGKGNAIKYALGKAAGEIIVIQDGDKEYNPAEINRLVQPIASGNAQVVYGSRFLGKIDGMYFRYWLVNKLLIWAVKILFGVKISDEATAYKAFDAALLRNLSLKCERFEFCPEVTAKVLKRGIKIWEVPITYMARTVKQGKKIKIRDAFEAFWTLLKYRFTE